MKFPQIAVISRPRMREVKALGAVAASLKRAGYRVRETSDLTAPEDVVFMWSWGKAMIQRPKHPHSIICCMDHGYTPNRGDLYNTGWSTPSMWCGLNGFGEHVWNDDATRARDHGWEAYLEPPKARKLGRALLLGQVFGDAMIMTQIEDYGSWLRETSARLTEEGWKVTFRPHPVMLRNGRVEQYGNLGRRTGNLDLRSDLMQADIAVALNSNGLVEAFLHGLPVRYYNGGSMLSPYQKPGETLDPTVDRRAFLTRLAWAQWTIEELGDGTWLKHHAPIMHRLADGGPAVPWHDRQV